MKRILLVCLLLSGIGLCAQDDSTRKQIAILVGGSGGAGFTFTQPTLGYNYGAMMREKTAYMSFTGYVSVLLKERIGFRLTIGRVGRASSADSFDAYAAANYPDYHYLPEYSELHSGYTYLYFVPQFSYRAGKDPFFFTGSIGAGIGMLHTPHGEAVLQKDGSNDFIVIGYHADQRVFNSHVQLDLELAYMRQLSQHLFANVGVYASPFLLMSAYEFHYSVTAYGDPAINYVGGGQSDGLMMHLNTGIFLNFQWNRRESPRVFYY